MTPADILADARYLPFRLDPVAGRVLFVKLESMQRAEASFLDDRALGSNPNGVWLPVEAVSTAPAGTHPAHFIFHIGHCGSTLLSRLLESWPRVQSLREPLPLRTLAESFAELGDPGSRFSNDAWHSLLNALLALWARPLPDREHTVIKASSSCNGLIDAMLHASRRSQAVLLDMALEPYLATLLKSADSVRDAANAAPERLRFLREKLPDDDLWLHTLSLPQQCAMGWLAEQLRFRLLVDSPHRGRVLHQDFDQLLQQPEASLHRIARHFSWDAEALPAALNSNAWRRYSKAQDHGYGVDDRAHDLNESRRRHAPEIAAGLAFADRLRARHPVLADAQA